MNRLKSPVLWCALAALALLTGRMLTGSTALPGQMDVIYNALLSLMAALGVMNNPTDRSRF
ncbi:MAG: hypothetical protein LKJ86_03635 [Oscillibacter sp.]|jgi:uncharacterized membrane protein|nr:hypothetical protein [Oscillibacter sp.]